MNYQNTSTVAVGVFKDRADAQRAVEELKRMGFTDQQIGVVARDGAGDLARDDDTDLDETNVGAGAAAGVATGAGIGGLWAIGIAAGVLPVLGPAIAGGVLASVLTSAAAGAAAGGLVGALVGLGIPKDEAEEYEEQLQGGHLLVTVRTHDRYNEARQVLDRFGATTRLHGDESVRSQPAKACATAPSASQTKAERREEPTRMKTASGQACATTATTGDRKIELRAEELDVQKRPIQKGQLAVHKEVIKEQRTIDVPVTREEIVVERHPVCHPATGKIAESGNEDIHIPVMEDEVHVETKPVVKEEVTIKKPKVEGTQRVTKNVEHEELRVDEQGDCQVRGGTHAKQKK
jgi:uncharacterized protein (TIGR02271 family)